MQAFHGIAPSFDESNLVSAAGLVPVMGLAERAGLSELVADRVSLPVANVAAKVRTVVAGMLAGADCIDDLDVLRAGGMACLVDGVRAPSTIGTFLREFTHGHVLQLGAVNRRLLVGLVGLVPGLVGGPVPLVGDSGGRQPCDEASAGLVRVDLDDTIREVHGYAKQGAAFGYSRKRGLNALLATVSTDVSAPVIAEFSLRRGDVKSGSSAAWFATRVAGQLPVLAPGRQVLIRGDAAFCTRVNLAAAQRAGAWYSFTIPAWPTLKRAIATIADDAWQGIKYPEAVWDDDAGGWVSDAEVAEVGFTAFIATAKSRGGPVDCRLVVRRVKRLNPVGRHGQDTLFDDWRYHAFITNSTLSTADADREHRQHAIIEQVIAELNNGPLAHLPSGRFHANTAWLACAVLAFNISRATAHAAHLPTARMATVLRRLIAIPARIASRARRIHLHLPDRWPWAKQWTHLWTALTGPPLTTSP